MSDDIRELSPRSLWNNFADLNAIPRPSKRESKVIEFIRSYGEGLNLKTQVDEVGNVIIKKPATKGMEDKVPIVLQSHLDMVHQKNSDTPFDFESEGINMYIDGDWIKARGTTLGADNGIGVAAIMSILKSNDIAHPPLEALFTIDEETGMTGALALKAGMLEGKILLNLDTEEDNELTIGCAGGVDVNCTGSYEQVNATAGRGFRLTLTGLSGGHSGVDIQKGIANSNKLMNRLLLKLTDEFGVRLISFDGGSLRNAIPREAIAEIIIHSDHVEMFKQNAEDYHQMIRAEYHYTDPGLTLKVEPIDQTSKVLDPGFQNKILRALYSCPNGIYRMSPDIPGLVQTSNNLARVILKDGNFVVQCLARSSVNSEKNDIARAIASAFELAGGSVAYGGAYPGWEPKPDTAIVKLMGALYLELFNEPAKIDAIHAGLECGIIGAHYPAMEMISFGPNIYGAHSPDEKVQISSVQKFWGFLLETLKRIPSKN